MNTYQIVLIFATHEIGITRIGGNDLEEAVQEAVAFAENSKKKEVVAAAYTYGDYTINKDFLENWPPSGAVTQMFVFDE